MSQLTQFTTPSTRSVVNAYSAGGVATGATSLAAGIGNNALEVLSGAVTAATLKTVLSLTGPGQIPLLTAYTKDATSRTVRCRVTVDGVVVFDATSSAITTSGAGMVVVGSTGGGTAAATYSPVPLRWNSSCTIQVASSLTETDKVAIGYALFT